MDNKIIFGIIFIAILVISLVLSWVMYSSESTEPKIINPKSTSIKPTPKDLPKVIVPTKKLPPPPNVYWSKFNKTLLDLEQERIAISHKISPINTKFVIQQTVITQKNIEIVQQDTNWSDVGKTLFELEQWRKDVIGLLQERSELIIK